MTRALLALLTLLTVTAAHATPPEVLHERKRAYLQAQLDAARTYEADTRTEGVALIGTSVAIPAVTVGAALGAAGMSAALGHPDNMGAAAFIALSGCVTTCLLSPYALLVGLTRFGDAELAEEEVTAREQLLAAHNAQRF